MWALANFFVPLYFIFYFSILCSPKWAFKLNVLNMPMYSVPQCRNIFWQFAASSAFFLQVWPWRWTCSIPPCELCKRAHLSHQINIRLLIRHPQSAEISFSYYPQLQHTGAHATWRPLFEWGTVNDGFSLSSLHLKQSGHVTYVVLYSGF